jgi:hypothetical protein
VVDKVALEQVFYEFLGFPCQSFYATNFSTVTINYIIRGWYNRPVNGRSTQSPAPLIKEKKYEDLAVP